MSTRHGTAAVVQDAVAETRELVARDAAAQVDLFAAPSSEEIIEARAALGEDASHLEVVRRARAGRPKNARNKRTDDLVAYLSQFGPDPAVAAMRIIAEDEELMIQRSRRKVTKIVRGKKDGPERIVTITEETMTFAEARSLRMRMIEHMTPYFHGKKPVAVDLNFSGLSDLIIAGVTHSDAEVQDVLDADFTSIDDEDGEP